MRTLHERQRRTPISGEAGSAAKWCMARQGGYVTDPNGYCQETDLRDRGGMPSQMDAWHDREGGDGEPGGASQVGSVPSGAAYLVGHPLNVLAMKK